MSEKRRAGTPPKKEVQKKGKKQAKPKTPTKSKEQQLRNKFKTVESENVTLKDQILRTAAELDNFRKRTEREFSQIIRNANEKILRDLLPVVDDLERSLKSAPKGGGKSDFHKGFELIYQKLISILQEYGLEPMESIGTDFNVEQHDALLQVEREDMPSGIVVEEHEKGYLLNGKVIRHAKVVVSK